MIPKCLLYLQYFYIPDIIWTGLKGGPEKCLFLLHSHLLFDSHCQWFKVTFKALI